MNDDGSHMDGWRSLLGKRVRVTLDKTPHVITEGIFIGIGTGGDCEVLEDDGFVHYCWPALAVEEVK